jgi:hypothetical protein
MSQVTADGLPEDGCLGLIPTHPCLQPIHLQPQKGSQANDPEWRRLCALAPAPPHSIASALDESPIPFSPTPLASPPSSSGHWSPSIPRPRFGKPSEIPGQAQCTTRPSGGISTSRIPLPIRIHQTVALQPGQEKPAEGGDEFQILQRRIPAVHQHILRPKTPLLSFPQHLLKMLVLGLPALGLVRKSQGMRAFPSVQSKSAIPLTTR